MDFYEAVKARRSVRLYKPTPVEPDQLARLWEAVRWAPSACNLQPYRFLVVRSPAVRERVLHFLQPWARTAPLLIAALGDRRSAWQRDGESIHPVDVAIAVEHLQLAAAVEGLGTCWICAFDRRGMHHALELAQDWDPVALITLGYSDDPAPQPTRKPLSDLIGEM
jgi:nitroreductase